MSRLSISLNEQQALILLLLSREQLSRPGERDFSPTHLRRALVAHLSILRDIADSTALPHSVLQHLTLAAAVLTDCLTTVVSGSEPGEMRLLLHPPLASLFAVERSVLGEATYRLDSEALDLLGTKAEETFESLYGHGELAVERGNM